MPYDNDPNILLQFLLQLGSVVILSMGIFELIWFLVEFRHDIYLSFSKTFFKNKQISLIVKKHEHIEIILHRQYPFLQHIKSYNPPKNLITEISQCLIQIKQKIVTVKKDTAQWINIYNTFCVKLENLNKRFSVYTTYKENLAKEDIILIEEHFREELLLLINELQTLKKSFGPQITPEIIKFLCKKDDAVALPVEITSYIQDISQDVDTIMKSLPPSELDLSYTINAIKTQYVPDTISMYLDANKADPIIAKSLFDKQMQKIQTYLHNGIKEVQQGNLDNLKTNGKFLDLRLS